MDKKELRQDLIRDKLINFIQFVSERLLYVIGILIILIVIIGSYSFLSKQKISTFNLSSEISALAQIEYNKGEIDFALIDLQQVLDNYEKTPGGAQSYIYLIYDAYINNDIDKLNTLLNNYSIYTDDLLLNSSILETNANISMSNKNYSSAIKFLEKSLTINNINSLKIRLSISKARVYIEEGNYDKAIVLLNNIKGDVNATSRQKNIIDELISYIIHIR